MRVRASTVAEVVNGSMRGPDAECRGATVDSRLVEGGELFVPIVAKRDGHDFISAALAAGAAAYLTARSPGTATAIHVGSTTAALGDLGRWARGRIGDVVVGITGSAGKTSTKDLLGSILSRRWPVAVSPRSFNNDLGVPLTLINAPDAARAAVLEMGTRAIGDIARLCEIARPTVGVVTNVGVSHTETLGSPEGVAQAKSELVRAVPPSGFAVLNAENRLVAAMSHVCRGRVITFGEKAGDVRVAGIRVDHHLRPAFRLVTPWGDADVVLNARGAHHVLNAAAAAAVALVAGLDMDDVVAGLKEARMSPWRMEVGRTPHGALVLNDSYNANPLSTEAALRALAGVAARRRIAVLGPMLELGAHHEQEHRRMGAVARSLGIDRVIAVAAPEYGGEDVSSGEEAIERLGELGEGDAVLVKGSRAAGLDGVASRLVAGTGTV